MKDEFSIDPGDFFRNIHCPGRRGKLLVQRNINGRKKESSLPASELARVSRQAFICDDITISPSRFVGENLLLNFVGTNTLFCKLKISFRNFDQYSFLTSLREKCIPTPTYVLNDGVHIIPVWVLDEELERKDFGKIFLLQSFMHSELEKFSPIYEATDVISKIPLPFSRISRTGAFVKILPVMGGIVSLEKITNLFEKSINFHEKARLEKHSRLLLELLALFDYRSLFISARPEYFLDWILFIGQSLRNFCTDTELFRELVAIAVALEGKRWSAIETKYRPIFDEVINGHGIESSFETWANSIIGRLGISEEEMESCGLDFLSYIQGPEISFREVTQPTYQFGHNRFMPIQRLLLNRVA